MSASTLEPGERRALRVQRFVGSLLAPVWVPVCVGIMRFVFRWRVEGIEAARETYARLRREAAGPYGDGREEQRPLRRLRDVPGAEGDLALARSL